MFLWEGHTPYLWPHWQWAQQVKVKEMWYPFPLRWKIWKNDLGTEILKFSLSR